MPEINVKQLKTYMTPEQIAALTKAAKDAGVSRAEYIIWALKAYMGDSFPDAVIEWGRYAKPDEQ